MQGHERQDNGKFLLHFPNKLTSSIMFCETEEAFVIAVDWTSADYLMNKSISTLSKVSS